LEEDLRKIWSTSARLYQRFADLTYRTDAGKTIEVQVEELLSLLRPRGYFA
jgi:hypothetical protein